MEKNWLIRTRSMQILGPIEREKVIELFKQGKIQGDDEVCSGNGFWFFIREKKFLERFLFGDEIQSFNPVAEAVDVLTKGKNLKLQISADDDQNFSISESRRNQDATEKVSPMLTAVNADLDEKNVDDKFIGESIEAKLNSSSRIKTHPSPPNYLERNSKSVLSEKVLYAITIILIGLALVAFYYRKKIIRTFIKTSSSEIIQPTKTKQII